MATSFSTNSVGGVLPTREKPYKYGFLGEDQIRLLRMVAPPDLRVAEDRLTGELITFTLTVLDDNEQELESDRTPLPSPNPFVTTFPHRQHTDTRSYFNSPPLVKQHDQVAEAPDYDALSYVWGGEKPGADDGRDFKILYLKNSEPRPGSQQYSYLTITPNLESALARFRSDLTAGEELYLWVDAVCMNQEDRHEKSGQIRKMSDIYSEASRVRVWLGESTAESIVAFQLIKRMLSFEGFESLVKEPVEAVKWDSFINLIQKSWFRRRWIVQELAFARDAEVYCGNDNISWDALKGAISLFASRGTELRRTFQRSADFQHTPDHLGEIEAYGALSLVATTGLVFRKSNGHIMRRLMSLESLLSALVPFEAKEPNDCLYAIMDMSNDARPVSKQSMDKRAARSYDHSAAKHLEPIFMNESFSGSQGEQLCDSPDHTDNEGNSGRRLSRKGSSLGFAGDTERGRPLERNNLQVHGETLRPPRARSRARSPAAALREAERPERERQHMLSRRQFVVDYDKSMLDLCSEMINFSAERYKSLDLICKPWIPILDDEWISKHPSDAYLPSWMTTLRQRPYVFTPNSGQKRFSRVAADPLTGRSYAGAKSYSACGLKEMPEEIRPFHNLIQGRILTAYGFELDKIGEVKSVAHDAVIPSEWLTFAGWEDQKTDPPPAFLKTLVANRESSDGHRLPPEYWPYACKWAFGRRGAGANLNPKNIIIDEFGKAPRHVLSFLHRMRAVVWDRKLFRAARLGNTLDSEDGLGLAPMAAEPGDRICILYGCSVPVVLRPKSKSKSPTLKRRRQTTRDDGDRRLRNRRRITGREPIVGHTMPLGPDVTITGTDGDQRSLPSAEPEFMTPEPGAEITGGEPRDEEIFSLIGPCYLGGMMDGEAFQEKKRHRLKARKFRLGCCQDCECQDCKL